MRTDILLLASLPFLYLVALFGTSETVRVMAEVGLLAAVIVAIVRVVRYPL